MAKDYVNVYRALLRRAREQGEPGEALEPLPLHPVAASTTRSRPQID